MKTLACTFLISCAVLRCSSAADAIVAEKAADNSTPPAEVSVVELKNKSSFNMEDNARNPFWPIGWKPAAKVSNSNERAGPEVLATSFLVSSIVLDPGAKFAIVNGKTMQEGQVFGLQMGNQTFQITVKSIEDGQVILMRRDQEIAVPLRRR